MRYAWLIVLAVVATTGCNQAELKKALAEAKTAEAQKDSLLTEVLETTQFVSDINSEIAKAKSMSVKAAGSDPGVPGAKKDREERQAALDRVKQIIARLNETVKAVLAKPAIRQRLVETGAEPVASSPEAFAERIAKETQSWAALVKRTGARID